MLRLTNPTWALAVSLTLVATACSDDVTAPDPVDGLANSHGGGPYPAGTNITNPGETFDINDALWTARFPFNVGTGLIDPFLTIQNDPSQEGFNTDASPLPLDDTRPQFTDALPLNNVPVIDESGLWREFILDANEPKSGVEPQFSIDVFDMWLCEDAAAPQYDEKSDFESHSTGACTLIYSIDGEDALLATSDNTQGSGSTLDYRILIPEDLFGEEANDACPYNPTAADCGYYIVLYTHMGGVGGNWTTAATFEEFSTIRRGFITIDKTANTSLKRTTTRTWTWTIEKEILFDDLVNYDEVNDQAVIQPSQSLDIPYRVTLDASSDDVVVDSEWKVEGTITIGNPSDDPVEITGIEDVISHAIDPDIIATVVCPVTFPHTLDSDESLVCTYSEFLPNADERVNRATATLADLAAVSSPNVPVDFSAATVTDVFIEIDECVDLSELVEVAGIETALPTGGDVPSGTYCASDGVPKEFDYTYTVDGEDLECGVTTVDNTASFETNDTQTQGSDDASLDINVECVDGCTLTQGYWKTHADPERKQFDDTWNELADGPDTDFFLSGQSWIEVFQTPVGGNQYYALAHQYMAAVLNGLAGADDSEVSDALDEAKGLFETYTPDEVGAWKGKQGERPLFVELAGILAAYNEGLTGPGHCTDSITSSN